MSCVIRWCCQGVLQVGDELFDSGLLVWAAWVVCGVEVMAETLEKLLIPLRFFWGQAGGHGEEGRAVCVVVGVFGVDV